MNCFKVTVMIRKPVQRSTLCTGIPALAFLLIPYFRNEKTRIKQKLYNLLCFELLNLTVSDSRNLFFSNCKREHGFICNAVWKDL